MSIASTIAALQPEEYSNVLMFLLETGALDALGQVAALVGDDDTLQEEPETDAVLDLIALAHHNPTLAQLLVDRIDAFQLWLADALVAVGLTTSKHHRVALRPCSVPGPCMSVSELLQHTNACQPRQLQSVLGTCIAATDVGQCLYCSTFRCTECAIEVEVPVHSPWHAVHTHACTDCGAAMQEAINQRRMMQIQHLWLGHAPGATKTTPYLQQPLLVTLLGNLCMGPQCCVGGVYWVAGQLQPVSSTTKWLESMLPHKTHGAAWQMMAANIQRASPNCRTTTLHHTAHPVSLGSLVDSLQAALLHRAHVTVPWHLTTALLISAATTTSYNTSPLLLLCVTQETCMHQRLLAHAAKVMGVGVHTAQPGCPLPASVVCHDQSATSKGRPCMVVQGGHMGAARDGVLLLDTTLWMGTKTHAASLQQVIDPPSFLAEHASLPSCTQGTMWVVMHPPTQTEENKMNTMLLTSPQPDIILNVDQQCTDTEHTPWWDMLLGDTTPHAEQDSSLCMHVTAAQRHAGVQLSTVAQQLLQAYFVHLRTQNKSYPTVAASTLFARLVRFATASATLRLDMQVQPFPDVTVAAWLLETSLATQSVLVQQQQQHGGAAGSSVRYDVPHPQGHASFSATWGAVDLQQVMDAAPGASFEDRLSLLHQELVHMTSAFMPEY